MIASRYLLRLLVLLILLFIVPALAEPAWTSTDAVCHTGTPLTLSFSSDASSATVYLTDSEGRAIQTLPARVENGTGTVVLSDLSVPEGSYLLFLTDGSGTASLPLTVTGPLPEILSVDAPTAYDEYWSAYIDVNTAGTLIASFPGGEDAARMEAQAGSNRMTLSTALPSGQILLDFRLIDALGAVSDAWEIELTVPEPAPPHPVQDIVFHTPNELAGTECSHEHCSWNLQMGNINDVDEIWQALISPMTVIEGSERHQVKIRKYPRSDCEEYTGEVTCLSQGVHILEEGPEWTKIEAYSSSVEGSRVGVFASCFTGYIETSRLKTQEVSQHVGLVIDKLQQRVFVFQDGRLISTLLCSTGFARRDTPFNETPAGEFYAISHTGGFWAGTLFCDMGIRINDGILLHEVPCTITEEEDGSKTRHYEKCEQYLGEKASHGCIRIQRATSSNGVSIKWLWDNLPRSGNRAKVIIWEESERVLGPASDDYTLYYNPRNGRQFHSDPNCPQVNSKFWPLTAFAYGDLEKSPYASLDPCPGCCPQLRLSGIDRANSKNNGNAYAWIRSGQ